MISRRRNTASSPKINEKNAATENCPANIDPLFMKSFALKTMAPAMAGIDKRKENSAAATGFTPENKPAEMVEPEREIPGRMATACPIPIIMARIPFIFFSPLFTKAVKRKITHVIVSIIDVIIGDEKARSKKAFSITPATPAGMVPTIR